MQLRWQMGYGMDLSHWQCFEMLRINMSQIALDRDDVELDILDWKETSDDVDVRWRFRWII